MRKELITKGIYTVGEGIMKGIDTGGRDNENKEGKGENVQKLKKGANKMGKLSRGDCIK